MHGGRPSQFCNKKTGRQVDPLTGLPTDAGDPECTKEDITTRVQFLTTKAEADEVIAKVRKYYEREQLRAALYYPILGFVFLLGLVLAVIILSTCGDKIQNLIDAYNVA